MSKFILITILFIFSIHALAETCQIKLNTESWTVKLTERQEKKIKKMMKKKGFVVVDKANDQSLELKLEISYKRGMLSGEIADSKSSAKILKGKEVIASTQKIYCAFANESYIDMNYGVGDIVLFGATEEGAHRRLIKSIKELPDCDEII